MTIRVVVADGHPVVRAGIRRFLQAPDVVVAGEAGTGAAAVSTAAQLRPDVVVLDATLQDIPAPLVCGQILERVPAAAVALFSSSIEPELVAAAADAGAAAYLCKDLEGVDFLDAVRRVAAGERLVDPRAGEAAFRAHASRTPLSSQELRVLRLAAKGCTNREIGNRLFLSRHTVKEYPSNAMRQPRRHRRCPARREANPRRPPGP